MRIPEAIALEARGVLSGTQVRHVEGASWIGGGAVDCLAVPLGCHRFHLDPADPQVGDAIGYAAIHSPGNLCGQP